MSQKVFARHCSDTLSRGCAISNAECITNLLSSSHSERTVKIGQNLAMLKAKVRRTFFMPSCTDIDCLYFKKTSFNDTSLTRCVKWEALWNTSEPRPNAVYDVAHMCDSCK